MRALPFVFATLLLGAGCTQTEYTPGPTGDGYGPAGGSGYSSSTSSGSSSGGQSTPPPPPSGSSGGSGGSGSSGGGVTGSSSGSSGSGGGSGGASGSSSGGVPDPGNDAGTSDDGGGGREGYDGGTSGDGGDIAELLPLCVSQINEFRNQNQEVPLTESTDLESYAAAASASDAHSGIAHGYFNSTGGGGVADTEDELDGARFDPGASAQQTMEQGLLDDEQDNGNAAANLLDTQFSQVGCGFAQDLSGNWWVVIALR
jgi:hypothetical protein